MADFPLASSRPNICMNIDLCFPTFLFVQGCIWIVFDLIMDKSLNDFVA